MNLSKRCRDKVLVYDGSKGVMLQLKGLSGGDSAEEWNLSHPEKVKEVYDEYIAAGSDVIQTNTFCANAPSLRNHGLEDKLYELNYEGARLALSCTEGTEVAVAASIGPTGQFFQPAGDMTFDSMVEVFRQQLIPIKEAGVSIANFETFTDLNEMRAAIVAAKELGGFEIISSMTFEGERTMSGNTPEACAVACAALGADIVGANCSGGPESLAGPIRRMNTAVNTPLSVKPNAGLPEMESGTAVFKQTPEDFARSAAGFIENGVRLIGGCCGSGPDHIRALRAAIDPMDLPQAERRAGDMLASAYEAVPVTGIRTTEMNVCTDSILAGMQGGDYYCLMDAIPTDADDADAVVLNFGGMEPVFDLWSFTSTLGMFLKKPVIVKAENIRVAEGFLRYYAGRAGLMTDGLGETYGAIVI